MPQAIIICTILVLAALGYISFWWLLIFAIPVAVILVIFLLIVNAASKRF